ncbi:lysophospholipid acyltransferase family protein [Bdellovibrio sp. HCB288]|uniref:lysophospholipid acyltransferase family protein n=1 Tax=Bdellovibrio sp. HCB288 TaxID=3394355 RepID=UPI0039B5D036
MFLKLLSYPRTLLASVLLPIHTVFCSALMILVTFIYPNRWLEDQIVYFWTRGCCWMFGVKVVVRGFHKEAKGGYLYVFNHTSFFDIFAMSGYLGSFRFGAKIELFKIPVFGWGMKRAGILPIARHRREEVFKVYKEAEKRIANGERFALAPEGTRQHKETLGPFKSGPFIFAINAKAPIVPVIVKGAAAIMPKGSFLPNWGVWTRTITLEVLPPVDATKYTIDQRPELQEHVRSLMLPYFPDAK